MFFESQDPVNRSASAGTSVRLLLAAAWNMIRRMDAFWSDCLEQLRKTLPQAQYLRWIQPLRLEHASRTGVRISAPNRMVVNWVRDRALPIIEPLTSHHFDGPVPVELLTREPDALGAEPVSVARPAVSRTKSSAGFHKHSLNPLFTFDTFVVGKANQMAQAAARQVAEHPGTAYNPLFVYGSTGLGKTHLMQAVGNALLQTKPDALVRYVHANEYISDVVKAYQNKSFDEFKQRYRSLDLLLIDDVHFFSGKEKTQEEFFYAFNYLIENARQVIVTSDTLPKEIAGMEERLTSRFGWGLTVAIEPPELEMRVAILLAKALADRVALDQDIAFFIARNIRSNVRELEGALKRVLAFSRFSGKPLTIDSAKEALRDVLASFNREPPVELIRKTVADFFGIKESELSSKRRLKALVVPRQIAMALARELTQKSLPEIGELFGGRDHTTVLHACRRVEGLRRDDSATAQSYDTLRKILRG